MRSPLSEPEFKGPESEISQPIQFDESFHFESVNEETSVHGAVYARGADQVLVDVNIGYLEEGFQKGCRIYHILTFLDQGDGTMVAMLNKRPPNAEYPRSVAPIVKVTLTQNTGDLTFELKNQGPTVH